MKRLLCLLFLLLSADTASAINVRFLKDTVISKMTEDDISHFERALADSLDRLPDGGRMQWSNPETGAQGIIALDETYTQAGLNCRKVRVRNRKGETEGTANRWNLCKTEAGWKIAP
ncbi:MAG: hypothetical protein KDD66_18335 [Bdellovibrionales bacterium]|nr:hypothetical protein [Bdellovibrionales bacterium]